MAAAVLRLLPEGVLAADISVALEGPEGHAAVHVDPGLGDRPVEDV